MLGPQGRCETRTIQELLLLFARRRRSRRVAGNIRPNGAIREGAIGHPSFKIHELSPEASYLA